MTSGWFFLSTLNYDARSTTHQINIDLKNMAEGCGLVQPASEYRKVPGFCEHVNEPSGSIK